MLEIILLVLGLICFVAAAMSWPPVPVGMGWAGLAFWITEEIVKQIPR